MLYATPPDKSFVSDKNKLPLATRGYTSNKRSTRHGVTRRFRQLGRARVAEQISMFNCYVEMGIFLTATLEMFGIQRDSWQFGNLVNSSQGHCYIRMLSRC